MGQARSESGMWRLPGSHGLSPENHTQHRNAGVDFPPRRFFLPRTTSADPAQARPDQALAGILREIMRVSKTGPVADPRA